MNAAVFADLCDYTKVTEQLGDEAAAEIAVVLGAIARSVAWRHGGRVVKTLGDGAHLHFSASQQAIAAALELIERVRAAGLPCVRVGVNAGPMVEADGDYYGRAVNIAARIAAQSTPGAVFVGESATASAGDAVRFDLVGPIALRGVAQAVTVYRALAA